MTGRFRSIETWRGVLTFAGGAIFLQLLVGGLRPVDGSMLVHFAQDGFGTRLPTNFAQYLFDSPLKVAVVHALHLTSPLKLATFFAVLTFLPFAAALLARDDDMRKTAIVVLAALPLTRISMSSLGVGDAVLFAVVVAMATSPSRFVAVAAAFVAVGWHVQQGTLIVIALGLVLRFGGDPGERAKLPYLAAGLVGGLVVEGLLLTLVIPEHQGRVGNLALYIDRYLLRSLFYWPAALVVAIPGLLSLWLAGRLWRLPHIAPLLLVVAFAIGTTTADVSRVFFNLSFPVIFLRHFSPRPESFASLRQTSLLVPVLAVSIVVPLLGWSGVQIFDWGGLAWRMGIEWGWSEPIRLFLDLYRAFDQTPP